MSFFCSSGARKLCWCNQWSRRRGDAIRLEIYCHGQRCSQEDIVGQWADMHLTNQLSRDLSGNCWLAYDAEFREWAAANGVRRWGELNLTIYGKCLLDGLVSNMVQVSEQTIPTIRSGGTKRHVAKDKVCFPWNFDHEGCNRRNCSFWHSCYHCSGHHHARDCKASGARSKKGRMVESPGDLPLH